MSINKPRDEAIALAIEPTNLNPVIGAGVVLAVLAVTAMLYLLATRIVANPMMLG